MKILTQVAKDQIRAKEDRELLVVSFALGLCGGRVRTGADFVDDAAWYVGQLCQQYVATKALAATSFHTATQHLEAAAKAIKEEIARRDEYDYLTECIMSDDASTIYDWAEKCKVDSIILKLIETALRDAREDDDDELFVTSDVAQARCAIESEGKKAVACMLVEVWQGVM